MRSLRRARHYCESNHAFDWRCASWTLSNLRFEAGDVMSENQGPGPLALVGSGEYLPQMAEIEGGLIAGRPPRYVQLATAAALEGPRVTERWHRLGREQAARLGVEAVALPVLDRAG